MPATAIHGLKSVPHSKTSWAKTVMPCGTTGLNRRRTTNRKMPRRFGNRSNPATSISHPCSIMQKQADTNQPSRMCRRQRKSKLAVRLKRRYGSRRKRKPVLKSRRQLKPPRKAFGTVPNRPPSTIPILRPKALPQPVPSTVYAKTPIKAI